MKDYLQQNYQNYSQTLPGHHWHWLNALRQQAYEKFIQQGFPTIRQEDWKYTNLQRLERHPYVFANKSTQVKLNNILTFSQTARLIFIDGFFQPDLSIIPTQIQYQTLSSAANESDPLIEQLLQKSVPTAASALNALNLCAATDGAVLTIQEHAMPEVIELVFYNSKESQDYLIQPRNLIHCKASSKVIIIEHYSGESATENFTNSVTEVILEKNAELHHIKLQTESEKTIHIGQLYVHQQESSKFKSHVLSYGGSLVRNEIYTKLAAENAETELFGLFLAQKYQHMDQHTFIDHAKSHCASNQLYRGILMDNAKGIFNGKVIVQLDAQKTNAHQKNNNLLLSNNAEIDTKPELLIYADDVQCSHGATVGQLDEQALFYLRARGLSLEQARSLLIYAFAAETLQSIYDNDLRKVLQQQLFNYLPVTAWLQGVCHE